MNEEAKLIGDLLTAPRSTAAALLAHVERLNACQRELARWLATDAGTPSPRLLTTRGTTAVLQVGSAAAATVLRYRREELLAFLRSRLGIDAERLEIRIDPASSEDTNTAP
ncbi:MAG: hypothetical protein KGJ55_07340 [Gammaproteobacteria bacterium]|nr:hypothetical protein [Gammaproteobacteria bacterium]